MTFQTKFLFFCYSSNPCIFIVSFKMFSTCSTVLLLKIKGNYELNIKQGVTCLIYLPPQSAVHCSLIALWFHDPVKYYGPRHEKIFFCHMQTIKPDRRSLISAFVVRCLDSIIPLSFYIQNFKPLPSFCGCAGRFESYLEDYLFVKYFVGKFQN